MLLVIDKNDARNIHHQIVITVELSHVVRLQGLSKTNHLSQP